MGIDRPVHYRVADFVFGLRRRVRSEEHFVQATLRRWCARGEHVLDVGCGYARFAGSVVAAGMVYAGVDINASIVQWNRERGRDVMTPSECALRDDKYDCIVLSHIIEHHSWSEALHFLATYVDHLKVGGVMIVITPLMGPEFYDDFDHVKPYNPAALRSVLCHEGVQARDYGLAFRCEELDFWMKRDPLWHSHRAGGIQRTLSVLSAVAFIGTFGLIGRGNGYGMVLRRIE